LWSVIHSQGTDLDRFGWFSFSVSFRIQQQSHGFDIETTHIQSLFDHFLQRRISVVTPPASGNGCGDCGGSLSAAAVNDPWRGIGSYRSSRDGFQLHASFILIL
jgi:hypothetical protein